MSDVPLLNGMGFDPVFDVELVRRALAEDIGRGDVTTTATIPDGMRASGRIVTRAAGVVAGLPLAELAFRLLDPQVRFTATVAEGAQVEAGARLAAVAGGARALLTGERAALHFLRRLCGIATLAAACVGAVAGTRATVGGTRKTTPGMRTLGK